MYKTKNLIFVIIIVILFSGCSVISEISKTIWGSSTRVLENKRSEALKKTYFCGFDECFDVVLSLARNEKEYEPKSNEKIYDVFLKDRIKAHVVVIGIEGNVDTTEVGIFLERIGPNTYNIEISSLSSSAKRKVAEALFEELDQHFSHE